MSNAELEDLHFTYVAPPGFLHLGLIYPPYLPVDESEWDVPYRGIHHQA